MVLLPCPAYSDEQLAELAGNLASRSGYDPEPVLQQLRIAFIVVPENPASATGAQSAVRQRTAEALDAQLETLMRAFLSDRSRNRYDPAAKTLLLSPIFDWYKADFERGGASFLGFPNSGGTAALAARYAEQLADGAAERAALRAGAASVKFLDYDWSLNDAAR